MNRRKRLWAGGAAALGAGVLLAAPLMASAQQDNDWVSETLSGLVSDGTITQDQADAVDEALDAARPERPFGHGHRGPGWRFGGRLALEEAATTIGIERDALRDALRDGQTIAEVATANGVEAQAVIDAMVAATSERLDELVADGRLDADEAAERLSAATERITTLVNEGFPAPGGPRDREEDTATTTPDDTDETTTTTTG